jgi:hypothetical protein
MKNSIFWGAMSCSSVKLNRRLGGICRIHTQGRKILFFELKRNLVLSPDNTLHTLHHATLHS